MVCRWCEDPEEAHIIHYVHISIKTYIKKYLKHIHGRIILPSQYSDILDMSDDNINNDHAYHLTSSNLLEAGHMKR